MAVTWGGGGIIGGGGGASPGGSNGQVQFNSGGIFAGDAGLTYNAATDTLTSGILAASGYNSGLDTNFGSALGINSTGLFVGKDFLFRFTDGTPNSGTPDSGLRRVSPGLVGVTSGGSNLGSLQAGNYTAVALATPTITAPLTVNGTPGVVTYGYKRVCYLNDGTSTAASAEVTVATGPATLGAVDNITVAWPAVTGEAYSEVYRTTGNGALGEAPPRLIYTGTAPTTIDVGAPGTSKVPATTNTTGRILVGDGSAAAPSVAFASEPTTGLRMISGSFLGITVAGTDRIGLTGNAFQIPAASIFQWSQTSVNDASDLFMRRAAAATLQLGAAPNATPAANTLIVGESGAGTDIAGANGVIQSGAGTGSGAKSHLLLQAPAAHGSDAVAQTQSTVLDLSQGVAEFSAGAHPALADTYTIGYAGAEWKTLVLTRATLGSKSKTLTDGSATAFATIDVTDGSTHTGEIIYSAVVAKGTVRQVLAGRARFAVTREGSTYTAVVNEVGTQLLAAAAGTLTGSISIAASAGAATFSANFDTSETATLDSMLINYRFDSVAAGLAITPL